MLRMIKFFSSYIEKKYAFVIIFAMLITATEGIIIPKTTSMLVKAAEEKDVELLKYAFVLALIGYTLIRTSLYI